MFDQAKADKVVAFVRLLRHTKGRWSGAPFNLQPWQEHGILRPLFGTVNEDGTRQYRTAYISYPRKQGKSELGAGIALNMFFADGEMGAEIYSVASDRDQAGIVFGMAAAMIRRNPALTKRCRILDSRKTIIRADKESVYRVMSTIARSKHGFNPSCVIFDELHAQPQRDLWDVMTTGSGTREQPLILALTTAGYDRHSICYEQYSYARQVREGIVDDPTFFSVVYEAEETDEWTDEATWFKANPALGVFLSLDEMRAQCAKARATPALENTFRRLRLNQWTRQAERWLPIHEWDACMDDYSEADLHGRVAYGGLDLASTTDITALVLVIPCDDGKMRLVCRFWIPADTVKIRSEQDKVPYDVWAKQGYVTLTPGRAADYDRIEADIGRLCEQFQVKELAFDPWNASQLSQHLTDAGLTMVQTAQTFSRLSAATKDLMRLVLERDLAQDGNPVLRWMADNVVVSTDSNENLKPDKKKSTERIDGIVALVMALDRTMRHLQETSSIYEERGIMIF